MTPSLTLMVLSSVVPATWYATTGLFKTLLKIIHVSFGKNYTGNPKKSVKTLKNISTVGISSNTINSMLDPAAVRKVDPVVGTVCVKYAKLF